MGYIVNEMIKLAQSQVGYAESPLGSNHNKYAQYFDTEKSKGGPYPWFNGKKQNVAWCAIWVCWLFVMVLRPILGDADKVRVWLKFPKPADNCAAGCPYLWQYLVNRGWKVDKKKGQAGDIIFFNAKCTHVGIIEKVENGKYYTIEGNKNNRVSRSSYSISSSSIYGVIHPDYAAIEPKEDPKPAPEPVVTPEPEKPAAPVAQKYQVKTNGGTLALRCAPSTKSANILWIPNKSEIMVTTFVKGEKIYGNDQWARATYKGKTGYCSAYWIKKS